MSKKAFKSQASSSRAVNGALGALTDGTTFGSGLGASSFGAVASSSLSYVYEPPDLSRLSEPNVGVAFKNIQKKDGTTKAKALDDLQTFVLSLAAEKRELEDAMLEAWIKVYPRTSIDTSRRVRQLAHTLQGHIALSCGKRMAKHMSTVVASWLAGLYDNDKFVNRAANESFNRVFASEEKRRNVWRVYQTFILDYSRDVIVKETIGTLSDERTTSPDDASAKYSRVVGTAIMLVNNLLDSISTVDLEKNHSLLDDLLNEEKVWKLATHEDSFVRRALYRLLDVALAKRKHSLNPATISASVVTSGLHANQAGSALDFVKVLSTLTIEFPDVWTLHYTGSRKKSSQNRLCHFLKRGSRGGPPEFWAYIPTLLSNLPRSVIMSASAVEASTIADDEDQPFLLVLKALHEGLNSKDEGRLTQGAAWNTYLNAFELVRSYLPEPADQQHLYKDMLFPILRQYISPLPEQSRWTVSGPQQSNICLRACNLALLEIPKAFSEEWQLLSAKLIEDLKTSLPEQSKEFAKSQDSISAETCRWYKLQASLLGSKSGHSLRSLMTQSIPFEIRSAVAVITARNGKPYGAAAALTNAIHLIPESILGNVTAKEILLDFVNNIIPQLILSPSAKYFIQLLDSLKQEDNVSKAYEKCTRTLTNAPESAAKSSALQAFISSARLASNEPLFEGIKRSLQHALKDDDEPSWRLVMAAVGNPAAPKKLTDDILATIIDGLPINSESHAGLHGLEMATKQNEGIVRGFALSTRGSTLLSALVLLTHSRDDIISQRARNLSSLVEQTLAIDGNSGQATNSIIEIINSGLSAAGAESLSVEALVGQAQKLIEQASPASTPTLAARLLPDLAQWNTALENLITRSPNSSLAITNSFGGALSLVSHPSPTPIQQSVPRDRHGFSSAFRMAQYTTMLISSTKIYEYATNDQKAMTCKQIALFLQLAGDNLSISGSMPLWDSGDPDLESEVVDLIADAQSVLVTWLQVEPLVSAFVPTVQAQLLNDSKGLTTVSYYSGRAYSAMTTEIVELHGHMTSDRHNDLLKSVRKSPDVFAAAAYLTSAPETKEIQRLSNELLADLTGHDFHKDMEQGLRKLVLLTCIFHGAEDYVKEIPQQRLVFFVKHAVQHLEKIQPTSIMGGQIMNALAVVLPPVREIYGAFWAELLDVIQKSGLRSTGDDTLFGVHASLRLLSLLKKSYMQEGNDDLLDALSEKSEAIAAALLELLTQLADTSDQSHQPRRIVNELLGRQLTVLPGSIRMEASDLYPVLASESAALQQTGYELLHNHISSVQEQVSVDKALSTDYIAQLPQELLSLILSPPTIDDLAHSSFERTIPFTLRSYLLSWKLVFDHWRNSSYKVQADYIAALQEGTDVQDFLSFALNTLISSRVKPVDASKFDMESYTTGVEESPEKETHWLQIHLYYLCLRYLPSITKTWWRDSSSRQLNIAVESWTEKYFSPLINASELSAISGWAPSQATADQPMIIKVSPSAREITASIPIDEQTMTIAIHLPKSYPLTRAEVTSVHRVGVAEKKWNFWLINTQGVINFSSGGAGEGNALIDGLMAWRRNVTAAMKGQTECAICYSVVSADRQLPSKKCGTCKNAFHSSCLFRWFKSSNSSSCPLCRNAFHYT